MIAFQKIQTRIQTSAQRKQFKHSTVFITGHLVYIKMKIYCPNMILSNKYRFMILIILLCKNKINKVSRNNT